MADRSNLSGAAVEFRDLIRGQAQKQARAYDQVDLGVVTAASGGIEVLLDSMSIPVPVMWAVVEDPALGDRVVMLGLAGGQQWIAVAKVREL